MVEMFRHNAKIKIGIAIGILLLMMSSIQYFSSASINDLIDNENEYHKNVIALSKVESIKASALGLQLHLKKISTAADTNNLKEAKVHLLALEDESKVLRENLSDSEQIQTAEALMDSIGEIMVFHQHLSQLFIDQQFDSIKPFIEQNDIEQKVLHIVGLCDKIKSSQQTLLNSKLASNEVFANRVSQMDLIATLFTSVILFFFGWVLVSDINKRNLLEKDLKAAKQKAEQSAHIKEQFMANMSHEIRTPMTSIIGFTNLLERTSLDEKQKDYVRTVKSAGENLLTIVNDILDFSKIEAGMIRFEETAFSVQGLLHSVNTMFLPKTKEKNIRLVFHPIENIPETLIGDPARLTQIMINLIGNAIKFTDKGSIEITAKLLKEDNQFATIQFIISDTGIGIPKDKLKLIFDRFEQVDAETSRRFGGTGLGLSIVKNLVELQGGIISVDSEEGKGSVFSITLQYKKNSKEMKSLISKQEKLLVPAVMKNISVLVAEDNPMNRKLLKALFSEWGVGFEFAENGKEVIEKFRAANFGLVLMDIQMPEINGFEATKIIREELHSTVPIIAMTAHALEGEREKCISMGMNDYISKPIHENELYALLEKYTQQFPSTNGKVTNLDFLTTLANGRTGFFNEMIQIFLEECPKELERLQTSIAAKHLPSIHANAHAMKSSIPFVGLDIKLNATLEEMETSPDLDRIVQLFQHVESVCLKAMEELGNK